MSEIRDLRTELARLAQRIDDLETADTRVDRVAPAGKEHGGNTVGRRRALKGLGIAATSALAGALATGSEPAAAATGDPVQLGQLNTSGESTEIHWVLNDIEGYPRNNLLTVYEQWPGGFPDVYPRTAAVFGWAAGGVSDGLGGISNTADGYGVRGHGEGNTSKGLLVSGRKATMQFAPHPEVGNPAPLGLGLPFVAGDVIYDDDDNLWLCVTDGSPGQWRKVAGPASSGAFHAIVPARVHDSRSGAKLAPEEERVVSVRRQLAGNVEIVPSKSTAVAMTLTVTQTEIGGYASVFPADAPWGGTSSINWFGTNQDIATTVISKLDGTRQIKVRGGGAGATHFVIDIAGYYL